MTFISSLMGLAERPGAGSEDLGFLVRDEAPRHRFVETACGRGATHVALDDLGPCGGGLCDAGLAPKGRGNDLVIAGNSRDFLDEVGGADDVTTPGRHANVRGVRELEAERFQYLALAILRNFDPAKSESAFRIEVDGALLDRRRADVESLGGFAAADVDDQPGQDVQAVAEKGRIDAAFEAAAGVAGKPKLLPGPRDIGRCEVGDLQHHVGGALGHAGVFAAHDPADVVHPPLVGNHRH